jgi:Cu2+-exporting ATPase
MQRLVERASEQRPRWAQLADRVAARFVLAFLLCALLNIAAWWLIDAARVLPTTLAVLAAACPCALALAVPAALAAAQQRMTRLGVLPCSADAIARLAATDVVAFDKTGTLTQGKPALAEVTLLAELDADQCLAVAAALERDVRHPLARAFVAHDRGMTCTDLHYEPGVGVRGRVGTDVWRIGRDPDDAQALMLTRDDRPVARFRVHDPLRADAAATCVALRMANIELAMYSGDAPVRARTVAHALAIDDAQGGLMPADKLARVRARQAAGARVAMVGDGINDAAVLAGADVSFAMADGAALAQTRADFVLLHGGLSRIPQALALARATRAVMIQNLSWAVVYNASALPFAVLGWLTPGWAALGMCVSSLLVTLNALRLSRWAPVAAREDAMELAPARSGA